MMKLTSLKKRKLRNRNRAGRLGQRTRSRLLRFESMEVRALLAATVINVDTFDDVVDAGDSVTSLREAIIQANSTAGDFQINLTAGTYALTIAGADEDSAATGDLDILNNGSVAIVGAGAELTVIDGSNLGDRILHVGAGASLDLSEVTVTAGGDTSVTAGGLANSGTLVLTNAAVTNNINGGIYNNGVATISGSTISGHVGGSGGAAILNVAGDLTVINSTISNNEATSHAGAGIHTLGNTAVDDRVTIIDSIISDNIGAGLRTSSTTIANITGTTITRNNSPGTAGGISGAVRQMTIENSIISDNTGLSGGIVVNGDLTIANSTISGNTARSAGGFGGGLQPRILGLPEHRHDFRHHNHRQYIAWARR